MTAILPADDVAPGDDRRIAEAAHEIRTPLGGMLALADLLLAEDLTDSARGHATALKSAAEHLLSIATTLLGGSDAMRREMVDLDHFLESVAAPIAARAAAKGLSFEAVRGPGLPDRVIADQGALRQIVENLADNAVRVTSEGSIGLTFERVEGDRDSVTLKIAVSDTGPGLGSEPERLFAPYVQGDGAQGAAGLGLALVARLAAAMDGEAEGSNRRGGGAEVSATVRLTSVNSGRPHGGPLNVLVAEDNVINQRVLTTVLEHFGHSYEVVGDGRAALERVSSGGYDIVLMDAVMPVLDGLAATRAIRSLDTDARDVRIVGVTARAFNDEIAAFRLAGADAVVTKPISVAELWRAIGSAERRWAE